VQPEISARKSPRFEEGNARLQGQWTGTGKLGSKKEGGAEFGLLVSDD
jgi:hypothetical protein